MVKCYVASKWENKDEVRRLQYALIEHGHSITEDWTHSTDENNSRAAVADWNGVKDCDVFIGLFDKPVAYKGALVEFGMAIAYNKIIVIIGHGADNQLFIHLSWLRKFETIEAFLDYITIPSKTQDDHHSSDL